MPMPFSSGDIQPIAPEVMDGVQNASVNALMRSGRVRYTPQQQQVLSKNAQTRAWLQGEDVPPAVRARELAKLDAMERRIAPQPVPADQWPPTARELVSRGTFRDTDGEFTPPGTTWIIDPKTGKADVSRNAPNNDLEYMRNLGPQGPWGPTGAEGEPGAMTPWAAEQAQQQAAVEQGEFKTLAQWEAHQQKQEAAREALRQKQAVAEITFAEKRRQAEQAAQADADKRLREYQADHMEKQKKGHELEEGFTPDPEKAWEAAVEMQAQEIQNKEYGEYLKAKYVGSKLSDIPEEDRKAYWIAKKGGTVHAPSKDWLPDDGPVLPEAARKRLAKDPSRLAALQQMARTQPLFSREQWAQVAPGEDYDLYVATMQWAKTSTGMPQAEPYRGRGPDPAVFGQGAQYVNGLPAGVTDVPPPQSSGPKTAQPANVAPPAQSSLGPIEPVTGSVQMPDAVLPRPGQPQGEANSVYGPLTPEQQAVRQRVNEEWKQSLPRPTSEQEYNELPPGSQYVYTDGSVRRKP